MKENDFMVVGAGPAGLMAAERLALAYPPKSIHVYDQHNQAGGMCRTIPGHHVAWDLGGHRFLAHKWADALNIWHKYGANPCWPKRYSSIYTRGTLLDYPLDKRNLLRNAGWRRCLRYALSSKRPYDQTTSLMNDLVKRYGRAVYEEFFEDYTRKLWRKDASALPDTWARERIGDGTQSTYKDFLYYHQGAGAPYEEWARDLKSRGVHFHYGQVIEPTSVKAHLQTNSIDHCDGIIWTGPISDFRFLHPIAEFHWVPMSFVLLDLAHIYTDPWPKYDQWWYTQDPSLGCVRIQFFHNWSDGMADPGRRSVCLEYSGDCHYQRDESELTNMAMWDLRKLGFHPEVNECQIRRSPHAYPSYDYKPGVEPAAISYLQGEYPGLFLAGRAGLHKYMDMDEAMHTGKRAAEALLKYLNQAR